MGFLDALFHVPPRPALPDACPMCGARWSCSHTKDELLAEIQRLKAERAVTATASRIDLGRGVWRCAHCKSIHTPNEEIADHLDAVIRRALAGDATSD